MTLQLDTLALVLAMAAGAAFCRFAGFAFMSSIPMTPRIRAGLAAMPLAVMLAIVIPPALRGGIPELAGIAATALAVMLRANEVIAIAAGMGAVAVLRALLP